MVGCHNDKETTSQGPTEPTNNAAAAAETTAPAPVTETPANPAPTQAAAPVTAPPAAPTAGAQDIKIAAGDTFSGLATKFNVTVKAIIEANQGVDAKKLQIGQTIHIPAPVVQSTPPPTPGATASTSGGSKYTVKSGDTLIGLAKQFGTSVKAIQSANNLKSSSIKVGQVLEIPSKGGVPPAVGAADTSAPPASSP
ncbi:MAG: hypothetical protein C5B50_15395 [Verrucomicrobia bacterium]|nr:MAG: hypothetical protein C5B50_15395 [Verrucomicrobiota bacterium]